MTPPPRPVWLDEEAEIAALLHAVLDRFDRQPGEARERSVTVPAVKHLGSLTRADSQADQSWALVTELARLGVLRIRAARRSPYDPEWHGAKLAFAPESEPTLRTWLGREWSEPALQIWRRAVQAHADCFADGGSALLSRRIVIGDRSSEDVVAALATIGRIREPMSLRQLSASAFWGDSKVLDDRGDLLAALFPALQIRKRAGVVAVYLPERCEGVLFIENQDTYIAATLGEPALLRSLALVYAAGFRGTAAHVRSRTGVLLHFAGPGVASLQGAFDAWWYEEAAQSGSDSLTSSFRETHCWFWGDLDFAGMQILKSLRVRFPALTAWKPGYEPLLAALIRCGGYRPSGTEFQGQFDPGTTGCSYADGTLLPAIRVHGQLDQEFTSRP